ncbi:MAG: hypothetical protein IPQ08_13360 [Chitinophagaceae bacterium]|nr:hypothetical protein [Chitinophagaceae bacterium]
MKKILPSILLLICLTSVFTWQSCQSTKTASASRNLKFGLENGKAYDYETILNMDQEIMGQKIQADMSTYYSLKVISDSADFRMIEASIDRFAMKTGAGGMNIEIDTDKPYKGSGTEKQDSALGMINKLFGAIRHQKFTMKVGPDGSIIEVTGFEHMGNSIADSMGLEGEQRAQLLQQFDKQFNGDEIKGQFERFWGVFPNKEVKVGDSWNKTSEQKGKMPGTYTSVYKVKDIEGDMVTLEEKTKVASKDEIIGIKGDIEGTLVIDSRYGLVVTADQDMNLTASSGAMSFEMKGKSRTKGTAR